MKRPSQYPQHEDSLRRFAELFNSTGDGLPLVLQIYQTENYRDDGVIVNSRTGKRIVFDWECRVKYFSNGKFQFAELRQFERKIKKDEIGLSLQCDREESALLVAWHNDFLENEPFLARMSTDFEWDENNWVRATKQFKIYFYRDVGALRRMLLRALTREIYDHRIFVEPEA